MDHAQNAALALAEAGALQAFVTTLAYRRRAPSRHSLRACRPSGRRGLRSSLRAGQSNRCRLTSCAVIRCGSGCVPPRPQPAWAGDDRPYLGPHESQLRCAGGAALRPRAQAVKAFEYTALASFERAQAEGVARILHLPSLDSLQFETIQRREKRAWPEFVGEHDAYFDRKFDSRYERRRREIDLADVIIANSSLTARSHIEAGADPAKVFVVPLAAPRLSGGLRAMLIESGP